MENNKRNLLFFQSDSMKGLHSEMDEWQESNQKRFLSASIERDGDQFCCIALTNPTEVMLVNSDGREIGDSADPVYVYVEGGELR